MWLDPNYYLFIAITFLWILGICYLRDAKGELNAKPSSIEIAEAQYFYFEDLPPDTEPGTLRRIHEIVLGVV